MYDLDLFYGPNAGYALELYDRYVEDPASVDPETRTFFESLPIGKGELAFPESIVPAVQPPEVVNEQFQIQIPHVVAASALSHSIRERGHLGAHLDPLGSPPIGDPALLPENHGISEEDLSLLPARVVGGHAAEGAANALDAINRLRAMYSGTISYEFDQIKNPVERRWLRDAVGLQLYQERMNPNTSRNRLRRLTQVEVFERYLHQTFPGQKRFSLEGNDVLVPMLDELAAGALATGSKEVIIGMAHRGRLNVLAHVMGKPYSKILAEFGHSKHSEGTAASESTDNGWSGDVKYHLGAQQILGRGGPADLKIILAPNPSHLEYVNPVIEGMARASQETRDKAGLPVQDFGRTLPVVIHGDAAFPGEGIVPETMNLAQLKGYKVGGTIHIIANNQIGFTTDPEDGRSTHFASDLAKGFEIPIIHVNADDPDAAFTAVRMAKAFRDHFHKDVMVDLVGYRRWGHNEGDEPAFTQPQMYEVIKNHPTVREIYARKLEKEGMILPNEAEAMVKEAWEILEEAKRQADRGSQLGSDDSSFGADQPHEVSDIAKGVSHDQLAEFNKALLEWPEGFSPNPKLARLLQRRASTLGPEGGIDWGQAEALAFASILAEGTSIRLTGQDAERGTFSHRHDVLHDQKTGTSFTPLQHLPQSKASFSIYNSPISEAAVLGFEYGYSVQATDALVLWEAQFGDFANVAQVIVDQFISSGRAKWRQNSSLVLLLPHGYEGQGPEHSSARLERYLQLSAGENWRVAICSTAAQYFHLLRLQAGELQRDSLALVIMTPKSLLRHPFASATVENLTSGTFHPVLDDHVANVSPGSIRRLVLCTGKMAIDMLSHDRRSKAEDVAIIRLEMLYPFPQKELAEVLARYPNAKEIDWVQEEPQNMGAWSYVWPHLTQLVGKDFEIKVISRPEQSSPATGFLDRYLVEQEQIIAGALRSPVVEYGGKHGG